MKPHCWVSVPLFVLYLYKEILIIKDLLERNRQGPKMQYNSFVPRVTTELKSRGTPRADDGSDVPASPPAFFSHLYPKGPHPVTPWWGLTWGHPSCAAAQLPSCGGGGLLHFLERQKLLPQAWSGCVLSSPPLSASVGIKTSKQMAQSGDLLIRRSWHRGGTGRAVQP